MAAVVFGTRALPSKCQPAVSTVAEVFVPHLGLTTTTRPLTVRDKVQRIPGFTECRIREVPVSNIGPEPAPFIDIIRDFAQCL